MTITIIPAAPPPHIASFAICLLAESKQILPSEALNDA
jgi:hypothetical protein